MATFRGTTLGGRFAALALLVAVVAATGARSAPEADAAVDPALEAQQVVYEINRARHSPAAFSEESGLDLPSEVLPRPPVALNGNLIASATFKANEMAEYQYFAHQSEVTGTWPNRLARDNGFPLPSNWRDDANFIESLNSGSTVPFLVVYSFAGSPSHRKHIFGEGTFGLYREIGVGRSDVANYWAVHTAMRDDEPLFVTGVVFVDDDADGMMDLGEGVEGIVVEVDGVTSVTNSGGGYAIAASPGHHTITVDGPGFEDRPGTTFRIDGYNVGIDFAAGSAPVVLPYGLCDGLEPTILGTDGDDVILGTDGDDVIAAFGGDDLVLGLGGNDVICGGPGSDTIEGGPGRDRLIGGGGRDHLDGGRGIDRLYGGTGRDHLFGASGRDRLRGGAGNDSLRGGNGNDKLLDGGPDIDRADGQDGDDRCVNSEQRTHCER